MRKIHRIFTSPLKDWEKKIKPKFKKRDLSAYNTDELKIEIDDLTFSDIEQDDYKYYVLNKCYKTHSKCFVCLVEDALFQTGVINSSYIYTLPTKKTKQYNTRLCLEKHIPNSLYNGGLTDQQVKDKVKQYQRIYREKLEIIVENEKAKQKRIRKEKKAFKRGVYNEQSKVDSVQREISKAESKFRKTNKAYEKKLRQLIKEEGNLEDKKHDVPILIGMRNQLSQVNAFGRRNRFGAKTPTFCTPDLCGNHIDDFLNTPITNLRKKIKLANRVLSTCSADKMNPTEYKKFEGVLRMVTKLILRWKQVKTVAEKITVEGQLAGLRAKKLPRNQYALVPYMGDQGVVTGEGDVVYTGQDQPIRRYPLNQQLVTYTGNQAKPVGIGPTIYTGEKQPIRPYLPNQPLVQYQPEAPPVPPRTYKEKMKLKPEVPPRPNLRPEVPQRTYLQKQKPPAIPPRPNLQKEKPPALPPRNYLIKQQQILQQQQQQPMSMMLPADSIIYVFGKLKELTSKLNERKRLKKINSEIATQERQFAKTNTYNLSELTKLLTPEKDEYGFIQDIDLNTTEQELLYANQLKATEFHNTHIESLYAKKATREQEKNNYQVSQSEIRDKRIDEIRLEYIQKDKKDIPLAYCLAYLTGEKVIPYFNRRYLRWTKKIRGFLHYARKKITWQKFNYRSGFLKAAMLLGYIVNGKKTQEVIQEIRELDELEQNIQKTLCEIGTYRDNQMCLPGITLYDGKCKSISSKGVYQNITETVEGEYELTDDDGHIYIVYKRLLGSKELKLQKAKIKSIYDLSQTTYGVPDVVYCATLHNMIIWIIDSPKNDGFQNLAFKSPWNIDYNLIGQTIFESQLQIIQKIRWCYGNATSIDLRGSPYQLIYLLMHIWYHNPDNLKYTRFIRDLLFQFYELIQKKYFIRRLEEDVIWWKYDPNSQSYLFQYIDVEKQPSGGIVSRKRTVKKKLFSTFLTTFLVGGEFPDQKQSVEYYRFLLITFADIVGIKNDFTHNWREYPEGYPDTLFKTNDIKQLETQIGNHIPIGVSGTGAITHL